MMHGSGKSDRLTVPVKQAVTWRIVWQKLANYLAERDVQKPHRPGARIQRINAYRKSGQYQAALHDCNEIILRFGEGYAARALIYELLGDNERALADHDRDIETSGENSGSLWNRGTLYERLGRLDLALADYSRAFKLNPHLTFIGEAIATLKEKLQECV